MSETRTVRHPAEKAIVLWSVLHRAAEVTVPFFYKPTCGPAWYARLVARGFRKREEEKRR